MKTRHLRPWRAIMTALAALGCLSAFGQPIFTTNTLVGNYVYPTNAADLTKPGFTWNAYQVAVGGQLVDIAGFESELVGNSGQNLVDPTEVYSSASADGTVAGTNEPVSFIIPGGNVGGLVTGINFNIDASAGNPDCSDMLTNLPCEDGMVGTPGSPTDAGGGNDNFVGEALTYIALPAGQTVMGVRSDDGFQLQVGAANPGDRYSSNAVVVTEYNGTRSFGDNWVALNVPKAGLYAARLLYFNGGGNASVEWYSFPQAGTSNVLVGNLNVGTNNAVLIGDTADGGLPAYRDLTSASLSSYCSFINPTPGSIGIPVEPTITAQIVNGSTPVSGITLAVDGTVVSASVVTTGTGATITYTAETPLANTLTHTAKLSWTDNGNPMAVTSLFTTVAYVTLDPSTIVTPNTNKPGFKFNIYANAADPFASSVNGIQGGETEFLDNIELGLNGLVTNGIGGSLPNNVTLSSAGPASGPAPALGGPSEPAQFVITNTISMTGGNLPGFPPTDGGTDPSHIEILTYVYLPAGLTVFDLNLDGWYRAFVESWDYTKAVEAGSIYNAVTGDTTFTVFALTNGYYPLRVTAMNTDGTPTYSLYTLNHGVKALVGDVANGGAPAYYELSTPSQPYIRYVSPRNVPHQMLYGYNQVIVRVQDGDNTANDSSMVLNMDGTVVTPTTTRTADVTQSVWTPTTLQTPAETHTAVLTYQDSGSDSLSNYWNFMSLKAIWLSTATPGYWLPTNAVAVETFDEYTDPTAFTNGNPTGSWYMAPAQNDPEDVAPIFNNTPAGPTNWYVWNWSAPSGDPGFTPSDPNSDAYLNFLCIDLAGFSTIESDAVNTAPFQWINGVPLVQLVANPAENVLISESDNRSGSSPGQTTFGMSKSFNLSSVANPVVAFAAVSKQNQDDIHSVEYSVDGGAHWLPVFYSQDGHSLGSDPSDIQINPDNTVNVQNSLFSDASDPAEVPTWTDSTGNVNNTYGAAVAAPITQALAPFMTGRINDDHYNGRSVEVVRLPLAAHQSNVRLRVCYIGTCSWYFGITQIAFYDVPLSGAYVPTGVPATTSTGSTLSVTVSNGNVNVTWTGSGTLQKATSLSGQASDWSAVTPAPSGNTYTAPVGAGNLFFRVVN